MRVIHDWLPYEEAHKFVQKLNLKSASEWEKYSSVNFPEYGARPRNIPSNPQKVYKDNGWTNWRDFLCVDFYSFEKSRIFSRKLGLKTRREWLEYCHGAYPNAVKKPEEIPKNPEKEYKNEWLGWDDWLGRFPFLSFEQAREYVRRLNITGPRQWLIYSKSDKPKNIPSNPNVVYRGKGWVSWQDWVGNGK